jgi:Tfp pilus assembly protein PilV
MWARARSEAGFTTIELLLAVVIGSVGIIALVGTFDISRRVTTYSEMKEAAAHIGEQKIEELRAVSYGELALNGDPTPASSTDSNNPAYYLGANATGAKTYRWNQKSGAAAGHTEPLVIDAAAGKVSAVAESWNDGRLRGKIHRYVTCAATTVAACAQGPDTSAYKRITVAVTIENQFGPEKPILMSTLVGNPEASNGEGANPLESPNTQCEDNGVVVECTQGVGGTVRTWYLYDTPATQVTRQDILGSHATHPTVAPGGTCTAVNTTGCPVPDLMGVDPPAAPAVTPPVYNYSNEIGGGSTPGGAVVRRDAACSGTPTATDNTKGHLWVTAPVSAPMSVEGHAALSVSTQTFNGVSAAATLCIALYNVPGNISNLVANPPTLIGLGNPGEDATWPTAVGNQALTVDVLGPAPSATVQVGNRLGVRVWAAAGSGADLVLLYDHPLHPSFIQVNED